MTQQVTKGSLLGTTLLLTALVGFGTGCPASGSPDDPALPFTFGDGDGDGPGDGDTATAEPTDGGSAPDSGAVSGDGDGDGPGDGDGDGDALAAGEVLYGQYCVSCHAADGTGGVGPSLLEWDEGEDALITRIDESMPTYDPSACTGECAVKVAAYVLSLSSAPVSCDDVVYPPRQLRLLTRAEYNNTVRDLLADLEPSCSLLSECAFTDESCTEGRCREDRCDVVTFFYPSAPGAHQSVTVAGSFNGWNATAPGYALTYDATVGGFIRKLSLGDGGHQYKFVVDGTDWVTDGQNPVTAPDGYGGVNSAVSVSCANDAGPAGLGRDFAARFPVETRPQPYPFDNSAEAALVSSVHVSESMSAAEDLAELAVAGLDRLVSCDLVGNAASCAATLVDTFGKRAWRRPLAAEERSRLIGLITGASDPLDGARVFFQVLLMSPDFLYRSEVGTAGTGGTYVLTPHEIASALSYTFTAGPPDAELYAAAENGLLSTSEGRAAEAERLLGTPRAQAVMERFAMQWWGTEKITSADKSAAYGDFTPDVQRSMRAAAERFVSHVIFEGSGTLEELFVADYTFVDPVLAAFYGTTAPSSEGLAMAPSLHPGLSGVFGQGALLATLAYPDQTSPVRRGLFVRRELLCQDLGTPPPNAGAIPEIDPNVSTRERFEQHSSSETCYACHQYIDDVGFGFESYDTVGRYRTVDNGHPIDSTGNMNDVEALGSETDAYFATPKELAQILVESDSLKQCFVRQVVRFVRGRMERAADVCAIDNLKQAFDAGGHDVKSLWIEVVKDPAFVTRRGEP